MEGGEGATRVLKEMMDRCGEGRIFLGNMSEHRPTWRPQSCGFHEKPSASHFEDGRIMVSDGFEAACNMDPKDK